MLTFLSVLYLHFIENTGKQDSEKSTTFSIIHVNVYISRGVRAGIRTFWILLQTLLPLQAQNNQTMQAKPIGKPKAQTLGAVHWDNVLGIPSRGPKRPGKRWRCYCLLTRCRQWCAVHRGRGHATGSSKSTPYSQGTLEQVHLEDATSASAGCQVQVLLPVRGVLALSLAVDQFLDKHARARMHTRPFLLLSLAYQPLSPSWLHSMVSWIS